MAIVIALLGFNDLGTLGDPYFSVSETDFISGSRDFTQHLTSGELILIHSADVCILV